MASFVFLEAGLQKKKITSRNLLNWESAKEGQGLYANILWSSEWLYYVKQHKNLGLNMNWKGTYSPGADTFRELF